MKKLIVISSVFALLSSGVAYGEVRSVAGAEIAYAASGTYAVSGGADQGETSTESSGELTVGVAEHMVIRTETTKVSFTPLTTVGGAGSQESVDAALRLLNLTIPEVYLSVMTLHQSLGGSTPNAGNLCEFIVLDELLDDNRRQSLRQLLEEAQVGAVIRNGFMSFNCHRGGLEDV